MATATAVALSLHVQWSRWFHCESSFDLSLVPDAPGLFALGQEDASGRKLSVVRLEAVDSLFHALNRLFVSDSDVRPQLQQGRCFVRFAEIGDAEQRQGALNLLENWLAGRVPADAKSALIEDFISTAGFSPRPFRGEDD